MANSGWHVGQGCRQGCKDTPEGTPEDTAENTPEDRTEDTPEDAPEDTQQKIHMQSPTDTTAPTISCNSRSCNSRYGIGHGRA